MSALVVDSGGITRLARRHPDAAALITVFKRDGIWPPVVPSVVLVESLSGRRRNDALINRFLKTCDIVEVLPESLARRAGTLRAQARRGSAVDAVVVAMAEPGGAVLSGDLDDLRALATCADDVTVHRA
jgi:predicted nucleic acid-binding protein